MSCSANRHMPTPFSTGSFTTPTGSISPARACDADAPDQFQRIDHQPATLPKIYDQQDARQPGDIISYRRATSSRNQRATSSESAVVRQAIETAWISASSGGHSARPVHLVERHLRRRE